MPSPSGQPTEPAAITQERMLLVQAKANILTLEPRIRNTQECIETLEDAIASAPNDGVDMEASILDLVSAMVKVQLITLKAGLVEGQASLEKNREVVEQIESSVKIFRPATGIVGA